MLWSTQLHWLCSLEWLEKAWRRLPKCNSTTFLLQKEYYWRHSILDEWPYGPFEMSSRRAGKYKQPGIWDHCTYWACDSLCNITPWTKICWYDCRVLNGIMSSYVVNNAVWNTVTIEKRFFRTSIISMWPVCRIGVRERVAQKNVPNFRMALCNRVGEINQQKSMYVMSKHLQICQWIFT